MASQTPDETPGKRRRRRWPWIVGAAVALVIVVLGIVGANARRSGDSTAASPPQSSNPAASPSVAPPPSTTTTAVPTTASSTERPSAPPPSSAAPSPADALRATFRTDHGSQPWYAKVTGVDLDGRAVIGRSTMIKGDQGALAACEALRSSATKAAVDFQSVAVRDADDRTLAHWSGLAGDSACTA